MHTLFQRFAWSLYTVGRFLRSRQNRWHRTTEFDERWKKRIQQMASYIDSRGPVADFGCGPMWLKEFLPLGNRYIPIDCVQRNSDTIVVDLNKDDCPRTDAEFAFFSGVLEYIADLSGFLQRMASQNYRRIILSYCVTDRQSNHWIRRGLNWVSHASIVDLLQPLLRDYVLTAIDEQNKNMIFVLDRRSK
jgi:hypothetical protein